MESVYLMPGVNIGRKELPGGNLKCKEGGDPLRIKDSLIKVIEDIIPFLKTEGKIIDQAAYDKLMTVEDEPSNDGKSEARIAVEKEATEFGIEFTDETTAKDLKAEIAAKKAETVNNEKAFSDLKIQAKELDIDFEGVSFEDLKLLVEDGLK